MTDWLFDVVGIVTLLVLEAVGANLMSATENAVEKVLTK